MNSGLEHGPSQNSRTSEIMSKHTSAEIIIAIRVSLQEFRSKRDTIQDLYAMTANTRDPNELLNYLMELSSDVLALVPGLEYIIHASPGNKYWHANLVTLLISELHRANDIWELADNQLGEINKTSTCDTVLDTLSGMISDIHNAEIYNAIKKNIA
jgi:hypothetical protein